MYNTIGKDHHPASPSPATDLKEALVRIDFQGRAASRVLKYESDCSPLKFFAQLPSLLRRSCSLLASVAAIVKQSIGIPIVEIPMTFYRQPGLANYHRGAHFERLSFVHHLKLVAWIWLVHETFLKVWQANQGDVLRCKSNFLRDLWHSS